MNKIYKYLNSHPNAMGVVEIEGTKYKISVADNLRYAERPSYEGWTNPYLGVWIICPKEGNRISEDGRIILDCFDPDLKEHKIVYSNRALLVGTKLYWEFDCRTSKTIIKLL